MKLLRLLTAGRSMVGVKDSTGRYRMTDPRSMPKFGSAKNPFRGKTTAEVKQAELDGVAQALKPPAKVQAKRAEARPTPEKSPVLVKTVDGASSAGARELSAIEPSKSETDREIGRRTKQASTVEVKFPPDSAPESQTASAIPVKKGVGIIKPNLANRWLNKISSVFSRSQKEPARRLVPQPGWSAVQGELSLDRVQVVRNDLSDSDLEVVRAKPPAKEKQGSSQADKPDARQAIRQYIGQPVEAGTM